MAQTHQLKNIYEEIPKEQKLDKTTQLFDEKDKLIRGCQKQLRFNSKEILIINYSDSIQSEILDNSSRYYVQIHITQNRSNYVMTTQFKLSNRIRKQFKQLRNYLLNNEDQNTQFFLRNDNLYIQYKQIKWGVSENYIYSNEFQKEIRAFISRIDLQKIKYRLFQGEAKLNRDQDWIKNELHKMEFQSPMMFRNFNALDQKYKQCQPFIFINVLKEEQDNQILFQIFYENNLYKRKYNKKFTFELNQESMHSFSQLQQQINGFLFQLSPKQQKILKKIFIQLGFDIKKKICYQFDQKTEDLNKKIQGEEFQNLSIKKQKKLIESVCIIYCLQEHSVLNQNYFNENVFQVDSKGKLKINFLQSNELIKLKKDQQNQIFQKCIQNKLHHLIELISFVVQINQNKQLSETDSENLVKLNQIVQYSSFTEKLQISQVLFVLDQITFCQKKNQQSSY
ncbi:unnamed protein product [Paramecium octaurelia]|uniref:Uncharacterized protein n=1 Tax=Paramecium octaurelia TaxID=43137 RepID=A0A8S1T5X7_PAROT|nr:unnamed protein product [Paramecium octaurelia]